MVEVADGLLAAVPAHRFDFERAKSDVMKHCPRAVYAPFTDFQASLRQAVDAR